MAQQVAYAEQHAAVIVSGDANDLRRAVLQDINLESFRLAQTGRPACSRRRQRHGMQLIFAADEDAWFARAHCNLRSVGLNAPRLSGAFACFFHEQVQRGGFRAIRRCGGKDYRPREIDRLQRGSRSRR
jgi:hypothetical protein